MKGLTLRQVHKFFTGKGYSDFLKRHDIGLDLYVAVVEIDDSFTVGEIHGPGPQQVPDLVKDIESQIILDYLSGKFEEYKIYIEDSEKQFTIVGL